MRLLNVDTMEMEGFASPPIPPYAILSHRWRRGEVSYKDFRLVKKCERHQKRLDAYAKGHDCRSSAVASDEDSDGEIKIEDLWRQGGTSAIEAIKFLSADKIMKAREICMRPGYQKISGLCSETRKRGLHWVWIDTCCINQQDSTELAEAINSMWKWYEMSSCCFVYLDDVLSPVSCYTPFLRSDWHSRGWTLQELLAPSRVSFFTRDWSWIADLDKQGRVLEIVDPLFRSLLPKSCSFVDVLANASRLPADVLKRRRGHLCASNEQRVGWARYRCTTKPEDRAYSLLGLFSIHMPIIYGEGEQAFVRLRKEIEQRAAEPFRSSGPSASSAGPGVLGDETSQVSLSNPDRQAQDILQRSRPVVMWPVAPTSNASYGSRRLPLEEQEQVTRQKALEDRLKSVDREALRNARDPRLSNTARARGEMLSKDAGEQTELLRIAAWAAVYAEAQAARQATSRDRTTPVNETARKYAQRPNPRLNKLDIDEGATPRTSASTADVLNIVTGLCLQ